MTATTGAKIRVWVTAGSGSDSFSWDVWRDCWAVSCRAPPVERKANRAVVGLMADWLGVSASAVELTKGATSRSKLLTVRGITDAEAERRLRALLRS